MRTRLFQSAVFAPDGVDGGAAAPVSSPAAESAPAPAPAVEATPAPSPSPAPVETPAPAAAPAAPVIATSLIEQGATPPAPTEAEGVTPPAEDAPASTEAPAEEAAAPYELALPEGIDPASIDQDRIGTLQTILAESNVPVEKGQELLSLHLQEIGRVAESVQNHMFEQFNTQQAERMAEVRSDPELGGTRLNTAMAECMQVVQHFSGGEAETAQLVAELKASGMGNSLRMLRFLANVHKSTLAEGSPVQTPTQRAPVPSKEQRGLARYNGSAAR